MILSESKYEYRHPHVFLDQLSGLNHIKMIICGSSNSYGLHQERTIKNPTSLLCIPFELSAELSLRASKSFLGGGRIAGKD